MDPSAPDENDRIPAERSRIPYEDPRIPGAEETITTSGEEIAFEEFNNSLTLGQTVRIPGDEHMLPDESEHEREPDVPGSLSVDEVVASKPSVKFEPDVEIEGGSKRVIIKNSCSFDVEVGVTGSAEESPNGSPNGNGSVCPRNQIDNGNGVCFWDLEPPDVLKSGKDWYVDLTSDTDHLISGNVWGVREGFMKDVCPSGKCDPWVGPKGGITKAEFTLSKDGTDYFDVSIIEGVNLPISMYPMDGTPDPEDRYTCGVAGGCTWDFDPGPDLEKYVTLVNDPGGVCDTSADCDNLVCGATFDTSPPTYGVCGEFNGYASAHLSCIAGSIGPPFFCESNHEVISCMGDYSLSGYNQPVGTKVCGCPDWESMGIDAPPIAACSTSDKDWEEKSLPFLIFLKQGCPMAYEFAYSDMTSTVICSTAKVYTIEFCPDDAEGSFFNKNYRYF